MTPFGRHPERSLADLATAAVRAALADAGVEAADVGAVMVGNAVQGAIEGQHGIRGQLMLRDLPLGRVPVVNVENACASALHGAAPGGHLRRAGAADVVLALGAEKMVTPDKERALAAFHGSWDAAASERTLAGLAAFGAGTPVRPT